MGVWQRVRNIKRYYVSGAWETILPQYEDQTKIWKMIEFDSKIYAGTRSAGKLLEWNGGDTWTLKAGTYAGQPEINIIEFDSKIYAGTSPTGLLLEWNTTGETWSAVAGQLSAQGVRCMGVHGGSLYGGTNPDGMLFKWDVGSTEWTMVADGFSTTTSTEYLEELVSYDGTLYCAAWGGDGGAKLLEHNSTGASWTIDATTTDASWATSLAAYNSNMYIGTYSDGRLLEWTPGTTTQVFTQKAGSLVEGNHSIQSLIEFDGSLYGGTGWNDTQGAKLFKWNDVDTWVQAADQVNGNRYIWDMVDLNGVLYAGTGEKGQLLKFVDR